MNNYDINVNVETGKAETALRDVQRGLNNTEDASQSLAKANESLKSSFEGMKTFALGASVALGAVSAAFVKVSGDIDVLAKQSARIGIATSELRGLQFAAEQSGASAETLNASLQEMQKRLGEASNGTGEAAKWLDKLGLEAKQLIRLRPEEQMEALAGSLEDVQTQAEKIKVIDAIFGGGGIELLNLLEAGEEGIRAMKEEGIELSRIDKIDAAAFESANDAINRANTAIQGVASTLLSTLAPVIEQVANDFADFTRDTDLSELSDSIRSGVSTAFEVLGAVLKTVAENFDLLLGAFKAFIALRAGMMVASLVTVFGSLGTAITVARSAMIGLNVAMRANPVGFIVGGITSAAVALGLFNENAADTVKAYDGISESAERANRMMKLTTTGSVDAAIAETKSKIAELKNSFEETIESSEPLWEKLDELNASSKTQYRGSQITRNEREDIQEELDAQSRARKTAHDKKKAQQEELIALEQRLAELVEEKNKKSTETITVEEKANDKSILKLQEQLVLQREMNSLSFEHSGLLNDLSTRRQFLNEAISLGAKFTEASRDADAEILSVLLARYEINKNVTTLITKQTDEKKKQAETEAEQLRIAKETGDEMVDLWKTAKQERDAYNASIESAETSLTRELVLLKERNQYERERIQNAYELDDLNVTDADRTRLEAIQEQIVKQQQLNDLLDQQDEAYGDLGNALGRWATQGKDAIAGVIAQFIKLIAIQQGFGNNQFVTGFLDGVSGFADGGRPPVNEVSIVGERGPELFVPDTAGTIVPNHEVGGAMTVAPQINFNGNVSNPAEMEAMMGVFAQDIATETKRLISNQRKR